MQCATCLCHSSWFFKNMSNLTGHIYHVLNFNNTWIYFWVSYSVLLDCLSLHMPIHIGLTKVDLCPTSPLLRVNLVILASLLFLTEFYSCFKSKKKASVDIIVLNIKIILGDIIFMTFSTPKHDIFLNLF